MQTAFLRWPRVAATWVLVAALAACGGGDGEDPGPEQPVVPVNPAGAGQLQSATLLGSIAATDIAQALQAQDSRIPDLVPRYDVLAYRLEYTTSDVNGQPIRASGLVGVPAKAAGAASPVLSYQHGTIFRDSEAPSNNAVASEVALVMASVGYIVLAPDYVGYGASKGAPHPYLLSGPSAAAVVDFLTAAQTWRRQQGVADNGQLFMTGYSEGGYVTLAAHRALQWGNSPHLQNLRQVVVGAGPYNVQATMDGLVDVVRQENKVVGALINPGFLRHLGGSAQREVRRALLKALLPNDADVVIDATFIDNFLSDDVPNLNRLSNVHQWRPTLPVRFYHGKDDRTVPYASAASTVQAMQAQGAGDLVSLNDCPATPAGHLECVPSFLDFMLRQLGAQAQGL
ncbi:MAG: lipase family protein [Simplicispira sp.]|uniref:alpha/beta hydrolase family protein n=1 Tax=Simplicispira sp. TaxID=2015802 RepID=UPI00258A0DD7|nr:lipase family protein [Simplicispira sp.]MDD2691819.1 lipase family protein [Simplicispira sp.]